MVTINHTSEQAFRPAHELIPSGVISIADISIKNADIAVEYPETHEQHDGITVTDHDLVKFAENSDGHYTKQGVYMAWNMLMRRYDMFRHKDEIVKRKLYDPLPDVGDLPVRFRTVIPDPDWLPYGNRYTDLDLDSLGDLITKVDQHSELAGQDSAIKRFLGPNIGSKTFDLIKDFYSSRSQQES